MQICFCFHISAKQSINGVQQYANIHKTNQYPRRVWIGVASSSNLINVPGYVEEEIPYDVYAETGRTSCVADAGCDGPVRLVRFGVLAHMLSLMQVRPPNLI